MSIRLNGFYFILLGAGIILSILNGCQRAENAKSGNFDELLNPVSKRQVKIVHSNFSNLRKGMNADQVFQALGLDTTKKYQATPRQLGNKLYVDFQLREEDILELLVDNTSGDDVLLAARLGTSVWPDAATWNELDLSKLRPLELTAGPSKQTR